MAEVEEKNVETNDIEENGHEDSTLSEEGKLHLEGDGDTETEGEVDETVNEEESDESVNQTENTSTEDSKLADDTEDSPDKSTESTNKRQRKKVERFEHIPKKEEVEVEGFGVCLGEIPYVELMLTKSSAEELKILHRLAYNRPGSAAEVKKNLRKFKGLPFKEEDETSYAKTMKKLEKVTMAELKKILNLFGLEKKGTKPEVCNRLLDYLLCPKDVGKKVPASKKKSKSKPTKSPKATKTPKKESKKSKPKAKPPPSPVSSEEEQSSAEEEEEVEEPVKPKKKTPAKKRKRPEDEDDEDDEPLSKSVKSAPPTDAAIKKFVEKILKEADLEEVTMKNVRQKVYDNYPKHDLTHKKDFIKETVKAIIS